MSSLTVMISWGWPFSIVATMIRSGSKSPMAFLANDRWQASFRVTELGRYRYTVNGWVDHFQTWRRDFKKKIDAGQNVLVELLQGARLIDEASRRASKAEGTSAEGMGGPTPVIGCAGVRAH